MLSATVGSVQERDEEPEDEGEEELRDGGVPFYVNRGGLPVDEETWERMWRHVARIHANGEALGKDIRGVTDLPKVRVLDHVKLQLIVHDRRCWCTNVLCENVELQCYYAVPLD